MTAPAIEGAGTAEAQWRPWLAQRGFAELDIDAAAGRRVVVVASHPDDDVLAIGGLLTRLNPVASSLCFVWATDGEASHPDSRVFSRGELASLRRAEASAAIGALGVRPREVLHLGLPDGGLAAAIDYLIEALQAVVDPDDVVIAPWQHDGHPDHDACGLAATSIDAWRCWQYPVWMWHWAQPGDPRVPWESIRSTRVIDPVSKARAISMFTTQIAPIGPEPADAAILPPHVLARFARDTEVVFT